MPSLSGVERGAGKDADPSRPSQSVVIQPGDGREEHREKRDQTDLVGSVTRSRRPPEGDPDPAQARALSQPHGCRGPPEEEREAGERLATHLREHVRLTGEPQPVHHGANCADGAVRQHRADGEPACHRDSRCNTPPPPAVGEVQEQQGGKSLDRRRESDPRSCARFAAGLEVRRRCHDQREQDRSEIQVLEVAVQRLPHCGQRQHHGTPTCRPATRPCDAPPQARNVQRGPARLGERQAPARDQGEGDKPEGREGRPPDSFFRVCGIEREPVEQPLGLPQLLGEIAALVDADWDRDGSVQDAREEERPSGLRVQRRHPPAHGRS